MLIMGCLLSTALINVNGEKAIVKTADVGTPVAQTTSNDFSSVQDKSLNGLSEKTDFLKAISHPLNDHSSQLPEYAPRELIVKFKEDTKINLQSVKGTLLTGIAAIDSINTKYGGLKSAEQVFKNSLVPSLSNVYKFIFSSILDMPSIINDYSCEPCVVYAEPNYIYHTCNIPNDPYFDQQWALSQSTDCDIDAPEAWDIQTGNSNVTIAIIDTGVDYNHTDLAANIWHDPIYGNPGYDFVDINTSEYVKYGYTLCPDEDYNDTDPSPQDHYGHGTHCAGIAGAVTNNGLGIAGVSWNCKIMPVRSGFKIKYLESIYAFLEFDDTAAAIIYAADNGADVISMSFGGSDSNLIRDVLNYAYSQGVVLVAAAGNGNTNYPSYPAAYGNVIAVAATDIDDSKASFSNYGDWVDVAAPGVDILSTFLNNATARMSGTSMACPHVAGLVALILSKNESYNQEEIRTIIRGSADKLPPPEQYLKKGRINAFNALLRGPGPATAEISFPKHGGEINGVINMQGSAYGEGFQYFTIEYGKCKQLIPGNWVEILNSTIPVQNGILASLDTNAMSEGLYDIRLTMVCSNGIYIDNIWIVINNIQNTFYVDNDGDPDIYCTSIREGIQNAGNGDTVYVYNGTYNENRLIWRSINLTGEEKNTTIVDGNFKGSVIDIKSDNVVVRGFTLKNIKEFPYFEGYYGCVKIGAKHALITDNIMTPGKLDDYMQGAGVYLRGPEISENIIKNNIIYYNGGTGRAVGVHIVLGSHDNIVENNEIYGCYGVAIEPHGSTGCDHNTVVSNYFHNMGIGVYIDEIIDNVVQRTRISSNTIAYCEAGVSTFFAGDVFIENNTVTHCAEGIELWGFGFTNCYVVSNNISDNDLGIYAAGENNMIYYNNFVNNTKNAETEITRHTWYNPTTKIGNYWDDYKGVDLLPPYGIGDTPYFINLINRDKYPLMKPYNGSHTSLSSPQSNQQSNPSQNQQQISQQMNQLLRNIIYNLILRHQMTNN